MLLILIISISINTNNTSNNVCSIMLCTSNICIIDNINIISRMYIIIIINSCIINRISSMHTT